MLSILEIVTMQAAQPLFFNVPVYENLSISDDADGAAVYMSMNVRPRPCFTWSLTRDVVAFQENFGARLSRPRCLVWSSETSGIFSLGGDLSLFRSLIETNDRKALAQYAEDCVTGLYNHMHAPDVVTVTLLEGDALGAGFEVALSSDIVIAERGTSAGFPEVLFNLVPGHGAFYLLARRIGPQAAEKMIRDGSKHAVEDLHAMGLIDMLVDKGQGRQAIRDLLKANEKTWNAFQALHHIKRHYLPITREALSASAQIWVDAAMRLSDRNLRMMEKLVRAQEKRLVTAAPVDATDAQTRQMGVVVPIDGAVAV
jgi:DSF synthase